MAGNPKTIHFMDDPVFLAKINLLAVKYLKFNYLNQVSP